MVNPTINSGTKYAKSHAFTGYDKPKVGVKTAYLAGNVTPQLTAKGDAIAKMAFKAISEGFKELSEPKGGLNFAAKDALNQFIMKAGMNAIMNGSYGMKDDGLKELAGTPSIPAELKEAIETVLKKSEDNKPALPELTDKMMAGLKELAGNPSIPAELKEAIETVLKKSEDNPIADINADPALLQKFLMDTGMGDVFGKPDNFENEQNGPVTSDDILGKILMILEKLMDANNDKQDTTNGSPIQTTPTASGQGGNQGIIIPPNFTGTITIGA